MQESASTITGRHYISEKFGGEIIFMVDPSGQYGLIVSTKNVGPSTIWSNVLDKLNTSELNGVTNTNAIVNKTRHTESAAQLCLDCSVGVFHDWYLPTVFELRLIRDKLVLLNFVLTNDGDPSTTTHYGIYWSSNSSTSFTNEDLAHVIPFTISIDDFRIQKDIEEFSVRAFGSF